MANITDLRLLLSEVIWLEPEDFYQARVISNDITGEAQQWQNYLNVLALLGFEKWLNTHVPKQQIHRHSNLTEDGCYINLGDFKVCLIANEQFLNELVSFPDTTIDIPEFAAHFYVIVEVLEEEQQVMIRGFVRHEQLLNYCLQNDLQPTEEGDYQLPLSLLDTEPNHLLFYYLYLEPTAIPLVTASPIPLVASFQATRTKLGLWLENIFDETWQAIDVLIHPEVNLAFNPRNTEEGIKKAKLINLGMQLGNLTVALLVNITVENDDKLGVMAQLHPTDGERYLPPNIKLNLLSRTGKTLQEVIARNQDNFIQLKPFKGEAGKRFSIQVSFDDVSITEDFEL